MRQFISLLLLILLAGPELFAQAKKIDSLQNIINLHRGDTTEVKALNGIISEYVRKSLAKGKSYSYQSIALARKLHYYKGLGLAYAQITITCNKMGEKDSAHYYLKILKEFSEVHPTVSEIANYNFTAGLLYRNEGKFKESLPYLKKALESFYLLKDKTSIAGQLLNIGNTYHDTGDFRNAVDYHLKALKMFEELKNARGESFCNQSIGNDFVELGRPAEALPYLEKALAQKEKLNDKRSIASAWAGLGNLFRSTKDYDKALFYQTKALKASQELNLASEEVQTQFNIGTIYVAKKDFPAAVTYLKASKVLAKHIGDSAMSKAVDSELIGIQSTITGQNETERNLLVNLGSSVESGRKLTELSGYEHLIDFYSSHHNFEKAFYYLNKLQHTRDSLQGLRVQIHIKELEERFKVEKKEKEIALLKKDQELNAVELRRQKAIQYAMLAVAGLIGLMTFLIVNRYIILQRSKRLVEIERVRNGIARDLHDDIGSTLSSINIISKMALQANVDQSTSGHFSRIEDHSRKMMDNMSDIVWSINPINDKAEKTLIRMKEFAAEILEPKNILYSFVESGNLSDASMSVTHRKNLFLIFKEAVNNAAKYSNCTSVTIELGVSKNRFSMVVRDNGDGFDQAVSKQGNGLANMVARAKLMGGGVTIESEKGRGTQVSLEGVIT